MVFSEFDRNCTLLIHRSHHHYVQANTSVAASLMAAAVSGTSAHTVSQDANCLKYPQQPQVSDLQKRLEDTRDHVKLQALKEVILWTMHPGAGDSTVGTGATGFNIASKLLMTIIRFVLPCTNHKVKKLLQLYWEIVDKTKSDGNLKEEMILACNKFREDLLHPNEYIRGSTLRLLCKMKFMKILEPLVEAVIQNLNHSHAYVRKNAIMCVFSMVRSFGQDILSLAAGEIERLLMVESDLSTKRNAFLMLINCDLTRAVNYALSVQDDISSLGDVFQLALLELLRKVSRENLAQTANLLKIIVALLDKCSASVAYEGSSVLLQLSSSNVAVKAATRAYIRLLTAQGDNNVKLILLDRLKDILIYRGRAILEEYVVDILRTLNFQSLEVKKRVLSIAMKLITGRTVKDSMKIISRELTKTLAAETQQQCDTATTATYQQLLIRASRTVSCHQLRMNQATLNMLFEFLIDPNFATSNEVSLLFREMLTLQPDTREQIIPRICELLPEISYSQVARICLWIIGEYSETQELRCEAINLIYNAFAPYPLLSCLNEQAFKDSTQISSLEEFQPITSVSRANPVLEKKLKLVTRTVILADGSYGTKDVYEEDKDQQITEGQETNEIIKPIEKKSLTKLCKILTSGDYLLGATIAFTLVKLFFRSHNSENQLSNKDIAKCLIVISSLLKFTKSHESEGASSDSSIRINQGLRLIVSSLSSSKDPFAQNIDAWITENQEILIKIIENENRTVVYDNTTGFDSAFEAIEAKKIVPVDPDNPIFFRQLGGEDPCTVGKRLTDSDEDLKTALGIELSKENRSQFEARLAKVQQMTGLGDPVFIEACLIVNQFDLLVEFLVINRTAETLQNVAVELATHGELKIVERPITITLLAGETSTLYSSIKVRSTESGIIFGHVSYKRSTSVDEEYLFLHEFQVDLLDFVQPAATIREFAFRTMWSEFEWENKISINTFVDVETLLKSIIDKTNMSIVGSIPLEQTKLYQYSTALWKTPFDLSKKKGVDADSQLLLMRNLIRSSSFFAINLYSRSVFDEDALANVSLEKLSDGKLSGHIRIRSRVQSIALCLGEVITMIQRNLNNRSSSWNV